MDDLTIRVFAGLLNGGGWGAPGTAREVWDRVVTLSHFHKLAPTLYRALSRSDRLAELSSEAIQSLRRGVIHAMENHALAETYLPPLIQQFAAKSIPVMVLKGWGLAIRYYDPAEDRDFLDIDLLFQPQDREQVRQLLDKWGFRLVTGTVKWQANDWKDEFVLKLNPKVQLECHFGLGYGKHVLHGHWERARSTEITFGPRATSIPIPHLGVEDEYRYLLYHAGVQHRFQKLGWLMDLAKMRQKHPELRSLSAGKPPVQRMADYFLSRYFEGSAEGIPPEVSADGAIPADAKPVDIKMDYWFRNILLARVEESAIQRARLRAVTQGGWSSLAKYAAQRWMAKHD